MQELVHRMLQLEKKAAAAIASAEEEAARILEVAKHECEKIDHEERHKGSEYARELCQKAHDTAVAERTEMVAQALREVDREIAAAEQHQSAGVDAVIEAVFGSVALAAPKG